MITFRSFVVLGLSLVLGLSIFGFEIKRAVKDGRDFDRFLSVKGLAEREAKADLALWPISFSVSAEDLGLLKQQMESSRAIVVSYLRDCGIGEKEVMQGLSDVSDREDERIEHKTPGLPRYRGLVTLVVRSPKVDLVKQAIQGADTLLAKGVNTVENGPGGPVQFLFNGINDVKPGMIKEATANARASAEKFAQDSNSKVGRIRRATQGVLEIEDRDAASPEWKKLRVVTTVDFFLE